MALTLDPESAASGYLQVVAGEALWSDRPLGPGARRCERPAFRALPGSRAVELIYDGPGTVCGQLERVRAWRTEEGGRLVEFESGARYRIAADGQRVARDPESPAGVSPELGLELAVGAPLALALAMRGRHLIHAAAVAGASGVVALCGDSGAGKSTLAAAAVDHPEAGLRRVADDILPVRLGAGPVALPHYPQLKLRSGEEYPQGAAPRLPLRAVVVLDRGGASAPLAVERLEPAAALAELVRAGVATRLFDRELLARHFEQCGASATRLVVARLRYPSGAAALGATLEAVGSLVGGGISD